MRGWAVRAVRLPFGDGREEWWTDESGSVADQPLPDADLLPGRYALSGLVDAHAHPVVASGPAGFVALDAAAATAELLAWAETGSPSSGTSGLQVVSRSI